MVGGACSGFYSSCPDGLISMIIMHVPVGRALAMPLHIRNA